MPVPNAMSDLSQLPGSNYPVGSEAIGNNLDNYLRAHGALIKQSSSLASATMPSGSTVNVSLADGECVTVTGSATISSLGVGFNGCKRELRFTGNAVLLHSSALSLPESRDITTFPGQTHTFRCIGPNSWALVSTSLPSGFLNSWSGIDPSSKENALGYTPVRQTGASRIDIGYDGVGLVWLLNTDNQGRIAMKDAVDLLLSGKANLSGANFSGNVSATAPITTTGSAAGLVFGSRNSAAIWEWSATSAGVDLFLGGSGSKLYVDPSGNFFASGDVTGYSDAKLKKNVRPITGALDMVMQLQGVRYEKDGKESMGWIAQQFGEVVPELRHIDGNGTQAIAYGNSAALLGEAIKELAKIVRSQRAA